MSCCAAFNATDYGGRCPIHGHLINVNPRRVVAATYWQSTKVDPTDDTLMAHRHWAPGACEPHVGDQDNSFLTFACPGCGQVGGILVGHPKPQHSPSWDVAGGSLADPLTLTLNPSINCVGCCGWHGYLRGGVFVMP